MKPLLIGGEWVTTSHAIDNVNPSDTADVVDRYAQAGRAETQAAVTAACEAFGAWAYSTPQQRHDVLKATGDEIYARRQEIGWLLSREEGKVLAEGVAETVRAAQIFQFFAGEALRLVGDVVPSVRPGIGVEITREPVGVVAAITPWNFPIAIPAWKIAPAICYGNAVVLKPAELVPGCAWEIADILHRSGLPPGVLNLVIGPGSVVGQTLLDDARVDAVTFTGSQEVGARVAEASSRLMRRYQLEMGGKNPLVVLDDADLELAVDVALNGSYFSTGQRCTASSRLIVTEGICGRFIETLAERLRATRVGHALEDGSQIGPVASREQLEQDLRYIEIARREGGTLRTGGDLQTRSTDGYFLNPALFTETTPAMRINRDEVFGPVAAVIRVRDYDEALFVANDVEFGLSAGICTTNLKYATDFKRKSEAGMVMVNLPTAGVDYHVPFGGRKSSSFGSREQGSYAKEFFTLVKTAYTAA